jgi:hypothetical protein
MPSLSRGAWNTADAGGSYFAIRAHHEPSAADLHPPFASQRNALPQPTTLIAGVEAPTYDHPAAARLARGCAATMPYGRGIVGDHANTRREQAIPARRTSAEISGPALFSMLWLR